MALLGIPEVKAFHKNSLNYHLPVDYSVLLSLEAKQSASLVETWISLSNWLLGEKVFLLVVQ